MKVSRVKKKLPNTVKPGTPKPLVKSMNRSRRDACGNGPVLALRSRAHASSTRIPCQTNGKPMVPTGAACAALFARCPPRPKTQKIYYFCKRNEIIHLLTTDDVSRKKYNSRNNADTNVPERNSQEANHFISVVLVAPG